VAIPLSAERLVHGLASANEPVISPNGEQIVYTRSQTDPISRQMTSQLWICDIDGSHARRLTWNGDTNRWPQWSPDGGHIAYISHRGEDQCIFVLPMAGGEARQVAHHATAVSDLAWSPDGQHLAYTAVVEDGTTNSAVVRVTRRRDYKHDGRGYLNDTRTQLFVVEIEHGTNRTITSDPLDHFMPQWSPDGKSIAVQVHHRNGLSSQLALVNVETGATSWIGSDAGVVGLWSWSPSGDRIFFAGDTEQTWQLDFFVFTVQTGETRRMTHDLAILPQAGFPTIWAPPAQPIWLDDHTILLNAISKGASGLYEVDTDTGAVAGRHHWEAIHLGLSVDACHRYVVQSVSGMDSTGEVGVYDRTSDSFRLVTTLNDALFSKSPAADWERFDVEHDGLVIEAWLLRPTDFDPSRRYPVILDVHGGPQSFYGYDFRSVPQCLATNDYLVVYANPRGSTSYGRAFAQGVVGDWGGGDYEDLMAVVDTLLTRPYADAERVGIFGYSYGGFMTSWTISQTHRFKAAVCGAPVFDLESFYGTSDVGYGFGPMEWGGTPEARREWCLSRSPSTFAHQTQTPTLIIHGEADDRCPIGQGEQMFVLLNESGCDVEFVRYPGGAHAMLNNGTPELRLDALTRILGWFDTHLKTSA